MIGKEAHPRMSFPGISRRAITRSRPNPTEKEYCEHAVMQTEAQPHIICVDAAF